MIFKKHLKLLLRNRIAISADLLLPLGLSWLFSLSGGYSAYRLAVSDNNHTASSAQFIGLLSKTPQLSITKLDERALKDEVDSGQITEGLVIKKGFGSSDAHSASALSIVQDYQTADTQYIEAAVNGTRRFIKNLWRMQH